MVEHGATMVMLPTGEVRAKKGHIIQPCRARLDCSYGGDDDDKCEGPVYCVYDTEASDPEEEEKNSAGEHACQKHLDEYESLVKCEPDHTDYLAGELRYFKKKTWLLLEQIKELESERDDLRVLLATYQKT